MMDSILLLLVVFVCDFATIQTVAVSEDGPPILHFVKQPPLHVDFSNNTGTTVECIADEGHDASAQHPSPTVTWKFLDGTRVTNITGLRQISPDGTMKFNPFSSESFRQDVHAASYQCIAVGSKGVILSNEVRVKAVMDIEYDVNVYDVFAVNGNTAIVKCHFPQFLKDYVTVISFIKDDIMKIPLNSNSESKYFLASHGVLYIREVDASDSGTSIAASCLLLVDPHGRIPPKIADSMPVVSVNIGENVLLPCVFQGQPMPEMKWTVKEDEDSITGERYQITSFGLNIKNIRLSDAGIHICHANSSAGSGQVDVKLSVKVPLKAKLLPPSQSVSVGASMSLECRVNEIKGSYRVNWIKDGRQVNFQAVEKVDDRNIKIGSVSFEDKGIYQCFVINLEDNEQAQASAQVLLGEFRPAFQEVFHEESVQPGAPVAFTCIVAGNPIPKLDWSLDGTVIKNDNRISIEERLTGNGHLMSTLSITSTVLEDGGTYKCSAFNEVGRQQHFGRLNVYGPLRSRKVPVLSVISGHAVHLHCPVYGYPIFNIRWEKGSDNLPIDDRQALLSNWTLIIDNVQRNADSGLYSCTATNKVQQTASAEIELAVMVLPKIAPFAFQEDLVREGMRAQIQCAISEGDTPLTVQWIKDGHLITNGLQDVYITHVDEYSSNLAIKSVTPRHNGNYTCIASNKAGSTTHTTLLSVNDDQNFKGMRAHITCAVSQGDLPLSFHWLKDNIQINNKTTLMGIQMANYDQYSSSLSIQSVTSENSGSYTCVATNEAGEDSFTAKLIVQVAPKIVPFQFQDESLLEGVFARVSCVVYQGDLPIDVKWSKDGQIIQNINGVNVRTVDDFTSILTIDHVKVEHSGNYSCMANNSAASAVHVAQLVVKVPPKIVPFTFQEDELAEGTFVRVTCVVGRGDLPLNFTWEKDGNLLPKDVITRQLDDYSSVLSIDSVALRHSGNYTCHVANSAAIAFHSSILRVYVPPRWINVPNGNVFAVTDGTIVLSCEANGYPQPTISWMKKDSSTSRTVALKSLNNNRFGIYANGTLVIEHVNYEDAGAYICRADNGIGIGLSRITQITVQVPIKIVNKSHDTVVRVGRQMILHCAVHGHRPINFTWTVDGKPISLIKPNKRYLTRQIVENDLLTLIELAIANVTETDDAVYGCRVRGKYGHDEATVKVTIEGPPEAPTDVTAVSKGDNMAEVNWKAPFDNHSPIAKYVIFYQVKSSHLLNRTTIGPETKIMLENLQSASTYHITVYAENANGRSEKGGTTQIHLTGDAPSGVPELIVVQPQNGCSLRVSWQPPLQSTWNGAILGYYVGYREASTSQPYVYHLLEIPEGYNKGLSFTLNELKEFTSYSIVVQAFNEHGKGPLSEEVLAMTSEGVPSRSPMAIDCSPTSSQTIVVSWEQPQEAFLHGILRGYKVLYWTDDIRNGADSISPSIQNTTEIKVTLRNLFKYANYSIQVLAYTFAGDGLASKPIYCRTLADVPNPPRDVKSVVISPDSVTIYWSPPIHTNGIIIQYTIYIQEINLINERLIKQRESRLIINGNKTIHTVENLRRGQRYAFHLTASTPAGEGASTKMIDVNLSKIDSISKPQIMAFGDKVKQDVNSAIVLPCPVASQFLSKRFWYFKDALLASEGSRISILPDGALQITTLYYSDTGNYSCHAENDYGEDKVTYEVFVKVAPSAPSIVITSSTDTTIEFSWKAPSSSGNSPILGYVLNYKQELGSWQTLELQPYMLSFTVTGLLCGSTYHMYMAAVNDVGIGQSSDTVFATTAGGVPIVPAIEKLIEARVVHVVLHLDSWISNGCPILYFVIEYKARSARSWSLHSNDIRPNRPSIILENLQPSTWYNLRMAAHTSAGSSLAEYEFSTLENPEGELNDGDGQIKSNGIFSIFDLNITVTILSCSAVILLCVAITCFWVKRHKRIPASLLNDSISSTRPRSKIMNNDDDDSISPYAMVKLSDFNKQQAGPSGERRRPKASNSKPQRFSNYNPTAPPMSESYTPHRVSNSGPIRKYPVLPDHPLYSMPNKEKLTHVRSEPDGASEMLTSSEEATFRFPISRPNDQEGQYDPPPPDMGWLCQ
ncbi:Down syndrome cell adhesion molecule-like protein 1 [Chamberlinius hualienensis]